MHYAGIDYHKRYSVISIVDDAGTLVAEGTVRPNSLDGFAEFLGRAGSEVSVVYECGLNWPWLYELLEQLPLVHSITLAHPHHTRLIAEAQIKTDKLDARKLANLLRVDMIPSVHVTGAKTRERKNVLRQRMFWVRERTKLRSRVHRILERQHDLELPRLKNLFGVKGLAALRKLELSEPDRELLDQDLRLMDELNRNIKELDGQIRNFGQEDRYMRRLISVPGIGATLACVIALEIDDIERFCSAERFSAYAGLVPGVRSSGGHTRGGRMLVSSNRWLKWAFIEAAWVAMCNDGYFGGLYKRHRERGKPANIAISIVARRMARIVYRLLKEDRDYQPISPGRSGKTLTESAAA